MKQDLKSGQVGLSVVADVKEDPGAGCVILCRHNITAHIMLRVTVIK